MCITNIKCDKNNYHSLSFFLVKYFGSNIWNGIDNINYEINC